MTIAFGYLEENGSWALLTDTIVLTDGYAYQVDEKVVAGPDFQMAYAGSNPSIPVTSSCFLSEFLADAGNHPERHRNDAWLIIDSADDLWMVYFEKGGMKKELIRKAQRFSSIGCYRAEWHSFYNRRKTTDTLICLMMEFIARVEKLYGFDPEFGENL